MKTFPTLLFDLDGTLLEFDLSDEFSEQFSDAWVEKFQHLVAGEELNEWLEQVREGVDSKLKGGQTNRDFYSETLASLIKRPISEVTLMVDSLLGEAFPAMRQYWRKIAEARSTVMCQPTRPGPERHRRNGAATSR